VHSSAGFLKTSVSDVNPASLFRRRRGFREKGAKKPLLGRQRLGLSGINA